MAAHEMASSSSSRSFTYDVFLNFRGEDTRKNFTVFLHKALTAEGINVFTKQKAERTNTSKVREGSSEEDSSEEDPSDEDSSDEKEIQPVDAIGQSKISIVIFSEGYADRIKCLKDLVKIVECHRSIDQKILPIFYDVEPADVRNQTGSFEKSFRNHKERFDAETVESWIEALNVVGDMTGYDLKQVNGNRSKLVDLVVNWVFSEVISNRLGGVKNLIGIEACVKDLLSLLNVGSGDIIFVGICGISGIGKTTIAKALYNSVFKIFDKSCFLENIREEELGPKGLVALQEQLLYKVSEKKVEDQIWNVYAGQQLIKDRLKGEKVLLVLDDVTSRFQLDALAIEFIWFGPGSRVIITSRDEHILKLAKVDKGKIYRPKELDDNESLQLFSLYAFSSDQPPEDYEQLSHDVLHLVGGLPLTIELLGSYFFDKREKKVWQNMILELKRFPHDAVQQKLWVSYESLNDDEKSIFLDAACFFVGWKKETVISLWQACGFEPISAIDKLTQRSLLKFIANLDESYDELWMHDQIQAMGRSIIYGRNHIEPCMRSRLWDHDEILDVLKEHKGTKKIEGILSASNQLFPTVCLYREDFAMMKRLRFLNIDGAHLEGEFPHLPSSLSWFSWWGCPLEILPSNFVLKKLVFMNLSNSRIRQAWTNKPRNEGQCFQKLKVLRLRFCDLFESPEFSWFPHLETLDLGCCKNMVNLHKSIGDLKSLTKLYLDDTKIEELPNGICRLSSLQFLTLNSCSSLKKLPDSIGDLKSLVTLSLDGLERIEELPNSICSLRSLQVLSLISCSLVRELPESIGDLKSLVRLSLDGTNIKELPHSICMLSSLQILTLNWCSSLRNLPMSIGDLRSLIELSILGTEIKELPDGVNLLEKLESFYIGLDK